MADTKPDYMVLLDKKVCPQAQLHDPEVELGIGSSYTGFSDWARAKSKTHRQKKCQGCGLWKIWEPR